ncbi:hypothetical protein C8J35_101334 [Rhizobium sp. PP-F2F-G38]|nr:hypothetical protein C8J37_101335 [Rhizobium sp. PP-WC-1G-195]PYF00517.1 hypothetical protein C8J35_101334 [Rhizobium sp. PP-F2F-G38]
MTSDGGPTRLPTVAPRPSLGRTVADRLRAGWQGMRRHLLLAPTWGLLMSLCALASLFLHGRAGTGHTVSVLVLYFVGGMLALPISIFVSRALSLGRRAETRFACMFLCLTLLTIGMTAFLFAMQYRLFFSRWHAPFATRIWFYQFAFTSAGAVYQFIVMGVRLYLPIGLPALLGMSLWLTRDDEHGRGNTLRR